MNCEWLDHPPPGSFKMEIVPAKGPCNHRPETLHVIPVSVLAEFQTEEEIVLYGDLSKPAPVSLRKFDPSTGD